MYFHASIELSANIKYHRDLTVPKKHKINNTQNNIYFCGTKPIRQHISHFSVVHCFPGCLRVMHYR